MSRIFDKNGNHWGSGSTAFPKYTYVGIALDRSGSMIHMKPQTLTGFNEHLQTIQDNSDKGGVTRVSLVTFGNSEVATEFSNLEPANVRPLNGRAYKPRGNTPMFDGIARLLEELEEFDVTGVNAAFLVIIISDGQENSSRQHSVHTIAPWIKRLKKKGNWTFAYVGANQDVYEVNRRLEVPVYAWEYTPGGTEKAYCDISICTSDYFAERAVGTLSVTNFFSPAIMSTVPTVTDDGSSNVDETTTRGEGEV